MKKPNQVIIVSSIAGFLMLPGCSHHKLQTPTQNYDLRGDHETQGNSYLLEKWTPIIQDVQNNQMFGKEKLSKKEDRKRHLKKMKQIEADMKSFNEMLVKQKKDSEAEIKTWELEIAQPKIQPFTPILPYLNGTTNIYQ